jgi:hypothetical protein
MQPDSQAAPMSKAALWAGRVLSTLATSFLLLDGVMKLFKPSFVVEATTKLGYDPSAIVPLGVVLLVCTVAYAIPATAVLGAILLTGYLGGAVASHLRAGDPAFPIAFPIIVGFLVWGGLWLRDRRMRTLVPWRR